MDDWDYGEEPNAKPDPIILETGPMDQAARQKVKSGKSDPTFESAEEHEVTFVELKAFDTANAPPEVLELVQNDSQNKAQLTTDSEETLQWLVHHLAAVTPTFTDAIKNMVKNRKLYRDLWNRTYTISKARLKNGQVHYYISFSGNPRLRRYITGTRYGVANTKVIGIAAHDSGVRNAWKQVGDSIKGFKLTLFVVTAVDAAEWFWAYAHDKDVDGIDLLSTILVDLAIGITATVLGTLAVMGLTFLISMALPVPVVLVLAGGFFASVFIGFRLDELESTWGWTRTVDHWLHEAWHYLVEHNALDYYFDSVSGPYPHPVIYR